MAEMTPECDCVVGERLGLGLLRVGGVSFALMNCKIEKPDDPRRLGDAGVWGEK